MAATRITARDRKLIQFLREAGINPINLIADIQTTEQLRAQFPAFASMFNVTATPAPEKRYTRKEVAAGGGYPCEVDKSCTKRTRNHESAKSHDTSQPFFHIAAV